MHIKFTAKKNLFNLSANSSSGYILLKTGILVEFQSHHKKKPKIYVRQETLILVSLNTSVVHNHNSIEITTMLQYSKIIQLIIFVIGIKDEFIYEW